MAGADRVRSEPSWERDQRGDLLSSVPEHVTRTMECAECRHPLVGDHTLKVKGATDPAGQFRAIDGRSSDR
jgi:hypothetical protein